MIQAVILPIGLTISLIVLFVFLEARRKKRIIQQFQGISLVWVDKLPSRYYSSNILGHYGILIEVDFQKTICKVAFPKLDDLGNLYYTSNRNHVLDDYCEIYWLRDVKMVDAEVKRNNHTLCAIKQLAPIVKEHLKIKSEILELSNKESQLNHLAELVATSDFYERQRDTYEMALVRIRSCLDKAEALEKAYSKLIREILIGVRVAEWEPEYLLDLEISFDLQHQQIKEDYDYMKNIVTAYYQLLDESKIT